MPALEAAHIRPFSDGGAHELPHGLPLRRDLHRLFDLGYVSAKPTGQFLVSPRLRKEFANGHTYALEGQLLRPPSHPDATHTLGVPGEKRSVASKPRETRARRTVLRGSRTRTVDHSSPSRQWRSGRCEAVNGRPGSAVLVA
jgi:hypothetical protein